MATIPFVFGAAPELLDSGADRNLPAAARPSPAENRQDLDYDLVVALEAVQSFAHWLDAHMNDAEGGLLVRRGKDARGLVGAYEVAARQTYQELRDRLGNERQRRLFDSQFDALFAPGAKRVAAHQTRELETQRWRVFSEASLREARRAAELFGMGQTEQASDRLELAVRLLDQGLSGQAPDVREEARLMLMGACHGTVVEQHLASDPAVAAQYLAATHGQIHPFIGKRLRQAVAQKTDSLDARAWLEVNGQGERELSSVLEKINTSPLSERQKVIARDLATDRSLLEQAQTAAGERRVARSAEEKVWLAVRLIDQGVALEQLPTELIDQLPARGREAVRRLYLQQISGQRALYNAELENRLHDSWVKALNDENGDFRRLDLTDHLGCHSRARLDIWAKRQDQLNGADTALREEIERRKTAITMASGFVARVVEAQTPDAGCQAHLKGRLNEAAIGYVFSWHDANPGRVMEPKQLLLNLAAMMGVVPQPA